MGSRVRDVLPKPRSVSQQVKMPLQLTGDNEVFFTSLVEKHLAEKRRQAEEEEEMDPDERRRLREEREEAARHDKLRFRHHYILGSVYVAHSASASFATHRVTLDTPPPPPSTVTRAVSALMRASKTVAGLFQSRTEPAALAALQ